MALQMWLLLFAVVQMCLDAQPVEEVIVAQKVPLLGGWFQMSPDSAEVQEAAQHAVSTFNANSRSKRAFKLLRVTEAQAQITNRSNFRIHAILGKTRCEKSEDLDLNTCTASGKQLSCQFDVAFDPRTQTHELQAQKCRKLEKKV